MPVQLQVKVRGGEVRSILGRLNLVVKRLPNGVMRPEMEIARDELRTYPAELPGQRYVRTGKRYAATQLQYNGGQSYTLVSNPTYAGRSADPYVVGDARGEGQAAVHAGRWNKIADVVERAVERIVQRAEEAFQAAISQGPGGL